MTMRASATFEIRDWEESAYEQFEGGRKLTRASVRKVFHGDLEGESTLQYLMAYPGDGTASFVGHEHVVGQLDGREGSFVIQHSGSDDGHTARGTWFVVPGSGTGELRGLCGEGSFSASRDEPQFRFTLDYDFT
jgi:hypothetical protein